MRIVIQRVSEATVTIEGSVHSAIDTGFLVLLGIGTGDTHEDADWLSQKLLALRIFPDENGLMNRSITDISGSVLLVSQFTLLAAYKKGNRPSFIGAATPAIAIPLYEYFIQKLSVLGIRLKTGKFGADMKVSLCNDGPVTIIMDSKNRE